mgnify:CR=1 FL=1
MLEMFVVRETVFFLTGDERDRRDCKTDYRDFTEKTGKSSK